MVHLFRHGLVILSFVYYLYINITLSLDHLWQLIHAHERDMIKKLDAKRKLTMGVELKEDETPSYGSSPSGVREQGGMRLDERWANN